MSGSPQSVGIRLLLRTLLSGVGLLVSATAASVYVAGDPQRQVAGASGREAAGLLTAARSSAPLEALVDSLIEPLGPFEAADSATVLRMAALVSGPGHHQAFLPSPDDPAGDSALPVFRAWARSTRMPTFWLYRPGFPSTADIRTLPVLRLPSLDSLFAANEQAADSALVRGDVERALQHARENIAAARHLLWQPLAYDAVVGRERLRDAAALLARSALQADQPLLHGGAQRLLRLTQSVRDAFSTPWSRQSTLGADPDDRSLLQLAGDHAAFPASRLSALDQVVLGSCVSTRDMLFGSSAARHAAIDRLGHAMRDVPRVAELRPLYHRALDAFDHATPAPTSGSDQLLRFLVPSSVGARVDFCRAISD